MNQARLKLKADRLIDKDISKSDLHFIYAPNLSFFFFNLQIHLRQFMGKRFSAMDPKCMTEEDMVSCGLLPSAEPPSVVSSDEEDE